MQPRLEGCVWLESRDPSKGLGGLERFRRSQLFRAVCVSAETSFQQHAI